MRQMTKGETVTINGHRMKMYSFTESKKQAQIFKRAGCKTNCKSRAYRNVNGVYQLFEKV